MKHLTLEVLSLNNVSEAKQYALALTQLTNDHPYYKVEFLDIFYDGLEKAKAFVFSENSKPLIVMPFYFREIESKGNTKYYDIISTWGYSGPLFNEDTNASLLEGFWSEIDTWYKENNVVSEFLRFNFSDNHVNYSGEASSLMNVVRGKLTTIDEIWTGYNRKVRKNVNKAKREGLTTKIFYKDIPNEAFNAFYNIFEHTMDRNNATAMYYYESEKLKTFLDTFPENGAIVLVYKDGKPISSEMILLSNNTMYSFIGGTYSEFFQFRPNDLLKQDIIEWAIEKSLKYYLLGGGYGKDDGIFNYKKSFFPECAVPFYIGKKIILSDAYQDLVIQSENTSEEESDFFPLYRKPKAVEVNE